ncbi:MAG: Uma2 family endonuclease, partial [Pseudomonadota bacterium]
LVSHQAAGPDFDLIIEVSDATLTQDLGWKAERYARHGVAEYWVVDLVNRLLHIHRGPGEDGYGEVHANPWDLPAEPQRLPGVALTLAEILEP